MKKIYVSLAFAVGIIGGFCAQAQQELFIDYQHIIEGIYRNVSGFGIPQDEISKIREGGGDPTYGEITYEGAAILLYALHMTRDDVFYDLGSGVGKMVWQVYLTTPVKKCVGIELSDTRYRRAKETEKKAAQIGNQCKKFEQEMRKTLKQDVLEWPCKKSIFFIHQNILEACVDDATVVYMCSTCYPDELMKGLTEKLVQLKDGLRVVTLKQLPKDKRFKLVDTYTLPMSWSKTSPVYVYVLDHVQEVKIEEVVEDEISQDYVPQEGDVWQVTQGQDQKIVEVSEDSEDKD